MFLWEFGWGEIKRHMTLKNVSLRLHCTCRGCPDTVSSTPAECFKEMRKVFYVDASEESCNNKAYRGRTNASEHGKKVQLVDAKTSRLREEQGAVFLGTWESKEWPMFTVMLTCARSQWMTKSCGSSPHSQKANELWRRQCWLLATDYGGYHEFFNHIAKWLRLKAEVSANASRHSHTEVQHDTKHNHRFL